MKNNIRQDAKPATDKRGAVEELTPNAVRALIMAAGASMQQAASRLPAIGIQTGSTVLNYVEKSITYYK
jgi:hypothetical protein